MPDQDAIRQATLYLLSALGEDSTREGLKETPDRVARFWMEFYEGQNHARLDTSFESTKIDQMVVVSGMRVWSMCEHHLLPFWADVTIAYMPAKTILGLSKFGRIAHKAAAKLQVQERMVQEIADEVEGKASSPDIAVIARGEHLCMSMRGIKTPAIMVSSVMKGAFRENRELRQELLQLCQTYGKQSPGNL